MLFPFPDPESALTLDAIVTRIQTLQGMVAADSLTQSLSTCEGQREGSAGQGWSWYGGNVGFLYLPKHLFIPFSPIFDTPKLWGRFPPFGTFDLLGLCGKNENGWHHDWSVTTVAQTSGPFVTFTNAQSTLESQSKPLDWIQPLKSE